MPAVAYLAERKYHLCITREVLLNSTSPEQTSSNILLRDDSIGQLKLIRSWPLKTFHAFVTYTYVSFLPIFYKKKGGSPLVCSILHCEEFQISNWIKISAVRLNAYLVTLVMSPSRAGSSHRSSRRIFRSARLGSWPFSLQLRIENWPKGPSI